MFCMTMPGWLNARRVSPAACAPSAVSRRETVFALVTKNCPQFLEILWGTWWAGCACVPVNAKLHGAEIGYILEQSGARICLAGADLVDAVATHAPAGA